MLSNAVMCIPRCNCTLVTDLDLLLQSSAVGGRFLMWFHRYFEKLGSQRLRGDVLLPVNGCRTAALFLGLFYLVWRPVCIHIWQPFNYVNLELPCHLHSKRLFSLYNPSIGIRPIKIFEFAVQLRDENKRATFIHKRPENSFLLFSAHLTLCSVNILALTKKICRE